MHRYDNSDTEDLNMGVNDQWKTLLLFALFAVLCIVLAFFLELNGIDILNDNPFTLRLLGG